MHNTDGWYKSSYSAENGGCIEVNMSAHGVVDVRDTKDRTGGVITFSRDGWSTLLDSARMALRDRS